MRVLIADVVPLGSGATRMGWQIWNDGGSTLHLTGMSGPSGEFPAAPTAFAIDIAPGECERVELDVELPPRAAGDQLRAVPLALQGECAGTPWRAVALLDMTFGPGGVVLPRTTAVRIE